MEINLTEIRRQLQHLSRRVLRDRIQHMEGAAEHVVDKYKGFLSTYVPVDTGNILGVVENIKYNVIKHTQRSFEFDIIIEDDGLSTDIFWWVNDGTGEYDPKGKHKIKPANGKAMKWTSGGTTFIRKSTKGQKGQRFVQKANGVLKRNVKGWIIKYLSD